MYRSIARSLLFALLLLFAAPAPPARAVVERDQPRSPLAELLAEEPPSYGEMLEVLLAGVTDLLIATVPETAEAPLSSMPVDGQMSSAFGYRRHPISGRRKMHKGLDFAAKRGAEVAAAGAGVVVAAGWKGSYGRLVVIDHGDGLSTRYAHLSRLSVRVGDVVFAGAEIATVGASGRATGPHLHFEVRQNGEPVDPERALAGLKLAKQAQLAGSSDSQYRAAVL